jgi:uncharacterized repeat protein (TIGR03803 family)
MIRKARNEGYPRFLAALAVATCLAAGAAHAATFTVLHNFTGPEGKTPQATLMRDGQGNLFGTAEQGSPKRSTGMVFELTPKGRLLVVHAFRGHEDGNGPEASTVIADPAGNLYGTTQTGGKLIGARDGTVFKIAPGGTESLLHIFQGVPDGQSPMAGLAMDSSGNLYGTTTGGGTAAQCGTVFRVAPDGTETVLHAFQGSDGCGLAGANLLVDGAGNIFGVTYGGGSSNSCSIDFAGCGTVFEISSGGTFTSLYSFQGITGTVNDGGVPRSTLVADGAGNLYGTTSVGGVRFNNAGYGSGTVFELAPNGTETVLYAFQGGSAGADPAGGVVRDAQGNLYGAANGGGDLHCQKRYGCGIVYELTPAGVFTILHTFETADGIHPVGGLTIDGAGNLYGTTTAGGAYGQGTIFQLTP